MHFKTHLISLSFLFLLLSPLFIHGQQNYLPYFDQINIAEETFVSKGDAKLSLKQYDKAFASCRKPFVSDLFIASEIAWASGDTSRFLNYISTCFKRGMTFECLHYPPLFQTIFSDSLLLHKLQTLYSSSTKETVNVALRDSVYMHYYREQMVKKFIGRNREGLPAMHEVEKKNAAYFNTFLQDGQFPSEQMIGLFSEAGIDSFLNKYNLATFKVNFQLPKTTGDKTLNTFEMQPDDYMLTNHAAIVTYMHYTCEFERNKALFWKAVEAGYLHPKDYCFLEEWAVHSANGINYQHDCTYDRQPCYYNLYWELKVTDPVLIETVENNRKAKHLQKYSIDQAKRKLQESNGFRFFFGNLSWR